MNPAVTVLVPTYRRPQLLARALRSIQAQTWRDFIVLVCDNASGDETAEVVAGFMAGDQRIRYHRHATNLGPQANFSWAFAQVESDFFCLLSDDDVLMPQCLECEVLAMQRHPQAMAWGGWVLMVADGICVGALPASGWPEGYVAPAQACALICAGIRPQNTGLLFRRAVLDAGFHPSQADFHASDVLWVLHAASKGGIGVDSSVVAVFSQHSGSLSTRAGSDPETGLQLCWPSARYLHEYFPRGALTEADYAGFRRRILQRFGSDQIRRLGRRAAALGLTSVVNACIRRLADDLEDADGAAELHRLARLPSLLLRTADGLRHRLRCLGRGNAGLAVPGDQVREALRLLASYG